MSLLIKYSYSSKQHSLFPALLPHWGLIVCTWHSNNKLVLIALSEFYNAHICCTWKDMLLRLQKQIEVTLKHHEIKPFCIFEDLFRHDEEHCMLMPNTGNCSAECKVTFLLQLALLTVLLRFMQLSISCFFQKPENNLQPYLPDYVASYLEETPDGNCIMWYRLVFYTIAFSICNGFIDYPNILCTVDNAVALIMKKQPVPVTRK